MSDEGWVFVTRGLILVWWIKLAWENSRHLATPPLFSPWNHVWETSAESVYCFRTCHCPDLGVSDWLKQISLQHNHAIRNITQIWVVTHHQYGISALVSQKSSRGQTSGGIAKCRLFSQAILLLTFH